jgi:hypothetical protein
MDVRSRCSAARSVRKTASAPSRRSSQENGFIGATSVTRSRAPSRPGAWKAGSAITSRPSHAINALRSPTRIVSSRPNAKTRGVVRSCRDVAGYRTLVARAAMSVARMESVT